MSILNKKNIILLLVLLFTTLIGLFVYRSMTFRLVGVEPNTNHVSVISPFIDISFNKPLKKDSIEPKSNTTTLAGFDIVDKKTIRVFFDDLQLDSNNTITIELVESEGGKQLHNLSFNFTAKDISFENLSKAQQEAILKQQDTPNTKRDDPVLAYVPYGGLNFELNAVVQDEQLILQAKLLLSAADVRIDANSAIERYKQEVRDYITSKGLNPDSYTIDYQVVQPTL